MGIVSFCSALVILQKRQNLCAVEKLQKKPPSAWAAQLSATTIDKVPLKWCSNPSKFTEISLISRFFKSSIKGERIKRYPYFATNEAGDKRIRWMSLNLKLNLDGKFPKAK